MKKKPHLQAEAIYILRRIESFFFPPLCIICDSPRPPHNRWFCSSCSAAIESNITDRDPCPLCGQNRSQQSCTCTITWDFPFEKIVAFVDYTEKIKTIIQHIKYHGKRDLAYATGKLCGHHLEDGFLSRFDLVIPVPLHRTRKLHRGYNQAERFARGLTAETFHPAVETKLLFRQYNTASQTRLDKSQRRENLNNAFIVRENTPRSLENTSVLLVDDVITTGATTSAATKVLLDAGCRNVTVLAFARD
jgi:ComF family protein